MSYAPDRRGPLPPPLPTNVERRLAGYLPGPAAVRDDTRTWRLVGLIAATAIAIGSISPWVSATTIFGTIDVAGTNGDGILTLVGAAVAFLGFASRSRVAMFIGATGSAAVAGYHLVQISGNATNLDTEYVKASPGWGLVLCAAAAATAVVVAFCWPRRA